MTSITTTTDKPISFTCEPCAFTTTSNKYLNQHYKSKGHLKKTNLGVIVEETPEIVDKRITELDSKLNNITELCY